MIVLYAGVIAGIVVVLPMAEAAYVLRWVGGIAGLVATLALLICMVLGPFSNSERLAQARREALGRVIDRSAKACYAGYSAFIGAAGTKLILDGHVMWGCVMLGAFAMIVFFVIVTPTEV